MGLSPMNDRMGAECDNCGKCISHCEAGALGFKWGLRGKRAAKKATVILLAFLLLPAAAMGHHILGIPHYAYDERYPQTPVLTYRVNAGPYEVKMTGYPGVPQPGEACSYHVYIKRIDNDMPFDSTVTMTVMRDKLIGVDPVIYGPSEARLEQAVYKFSPRFDQEANFTLRIAYEAEGAPWIIDLPVVVGEPGSPWAVVGGVLGGALLFLAVIRAIRIKLMRKKREAAGTPACSFPRSVES